MKFDSQLTMTAIELALALEFESNNSLVIIHEIGPDHEILLEY